MASASSRERRAGAGRGGAQRLALLRWRLTPRLMVTPAVLGFAVFTLYPLVYLVALSLSESSLGQPFRSWVGLEHYADLAADAVFRGSLARSVLYAVGVTLVELVLGVAIALLLATGVRQGSAVRTLILLPLMTPPITVTVVWKLLLAPEGGAVNTVLEGLGLIDTPISFLGTGTLALLAVMLADVWQWTPFVVLLAYAALQSQPEDVLEAARVDGASAWRAFRSVTLPMILPALLSILLLRLILAFKVFDLIYGLTFGGPGFDTTTGTFEIFRTGLREFNVGRAAAQTVLFAILVGLATLPLMVLRTRALRRER